MEGAGGMAVVSGMGCLSAGGLDLASVWQGLLAGEVACRPVPSHLFDTVLEYPVFAASTDPLTPAARRLILECRSDFEPGTFSRTVQLSISAVAEALSQAGIEPGYLVERRVGIVMGTTVGCTFHDEDYYRAWREGGEPDLAPISSFIGGNLAAALHWVLGTDGPSAVVTNACASGTDAIGIARDWLLNGRCDLAIAGGADALSRIAYNGFASLMLTDSGIARPFDKNRQGLNLGEGAGALVMEREEDLRGRGVDPLGRVLAYGCAADAWHPTAPHPEGRGLKDALLSVIHEADRCGPPALINAHGTGTRANDLAETTALAEVFGRGTDIPIVSTKGVTGHTLGAAGAIEAIFTLMALRHGFSPGTTGCVEIDPAFPIRPRPQGEGSRLASAWGLSESLAFGGGNSVLALEAG